MHQLRVRMTLYKVRVRYMYLVVGLVIMTAPDDELGANAVYMYICLHCEATMTRSNGH